MHIGFVTENKLLNIMKIILLLTIIIIISGCTVSARNHHFELVDYTSKEYDDFHNIWCFTDNQNTSVLVCSSPFKTRSESIGFILPLLPQLNRDSRLAYDITSERLIELKNTDPVTQVTIKELNGIQQCTNEHGMECQLQSIISIKANSSIWLKIPTGNIHEFSVYIGENRYRIKLKEFSEVRWHLVSV